MQINEDKACDVILIFETFEVRLFNLTSKVSKRYFGQHFFDSSSSSFYPVRLLNLLGTCLQLTLRVNTKCQSTILSDE